VNKAMVHTALIALAAVAVVALIQSKVANVPLVGAYLPGYTAR